MFSGSGYCRFSSPVVPMAVSDYRSVVNGKSKQALCRVGPLVTVFLLNNHFGFFFLGEIKQWRLRRVWLSTYSDSAFL